MAPGRNQATLTLADGRTIVLTRDLNGQLAQQGQTTITANNKEGIVYATGSTSTTTTISWNTLATARGEQSPYPLTLPDGTKVWLNAASTITFPTVFNANARTVKITGEVYFEVMHNEKHPFRVEAKDQLIEDIGTHFNVNAYDDEDAFRTTLLEGSVKVSVIGNRQSAILKPGEQVSFSQSSQLSQPIPVQTDEVLAWKEGMFRFSSGRTRQYHAHHFPLVQCRNSICRSGSQITPVRRPGHPLCQCIADPAHAGAYQRSSF